MEAITHPGFSKSDRRRKRKDYAAVNSVELRVAPKLFAFINCPIDDGDYKLRLALGKITRVEGDEVTVAWLMYAKYPASTPDNHKGPWKRQIKQQRGQSQDYGSCHKKQIVFTFDKLNSNKTLPSKYLKVVEALVAHGLPAPEDIPLPGVFVSLL